MHTPESVRSAILAGVPNCSQVLVHDDSDGCGSKFTCVVVSTEFEGKGLLDRQRMVNDSLHKEMADIHALQMKTWTPQQFEARKGEIENLSDFVGA